MTRVIELTRGFVSTSNIQELMQCKLFNFSDEHIQEQVGVPFRVDAHDRHQHLQLVECSHLGDRAQHRRNRRDRSPQSPNQSRTVQQEPLNNRHR